jgi:dolichol-phosphate mannosyltransferase
VQSDVVDFVVPVYNEGKNIGRMLEELYAAVALEKRVLVVYDFEGDNTVPVVKELQPQYPGLELVLNTRARGVLNAIRCGIDNARGDVVIITMADLSDQPSVIPVMVEQIRSGNMDVVCASRYMRGGRQIGGPKLKSFLSRVAGISLHLLGFPVHDATNAFRAYRREVLQGIPIESQGGGFAYSLELTAKAYAAGYKVGEVPTTWRDRSAGESRFRLMQWIPTYLRWYFYALTHGRFRPRRPQTHG